MSDRSCHRPARSGPLLPIVFLSSLLLLLPAVAHTAPGDVSPDGVWAERPDRFLAGAVAGDSFDSPDAYAIFEIDRRSLNRILERAPREFSPGADLVNTVLTLPLPDGTYERFRITRTEMLSPELAARHPDVRPKVTSELLESLRLALSAD